MAFRSFILALCTLAAINLALPADAWAEYGATIEATSCNPGQDPAVDANHQWYLKSCTSRGVRLNDFRVLVKFKPDNDFVNKYVLDNELVMMAAYAAVYYATAKAVELGTHYSLSNICATCEPANTVASVLAGRKAGLAAVVVAIVAANAVLIATEPWNADHSTDVDNTAINATGREDNAGRNFSSWIKIGTRGVGLAPTLVGPMVRASVDIKGDKACVTMTEGVLHWFTFKAERSEDFNKLYGIDEQKNEEIEKNYPGRSSLGLPKNCVYLPMPPKTPQPPSPSFISKSCLNYDTNASMFRWPHSGLVDSQPQSRAVLGVVVQCIEETMTNLFFGSHNFSNQQNTSVFVQMQAQLASYVKALMVLYIIMLGYKYGLIERSGVKQSEFIWIGLRITLVLYFATGTAMTEFLPGIINGTKQLSAIVLNAAAGPETANSDKVRVRRELKEAEDAYDLARREYADARKNWSQTTDVAAKAARKATMDTKQKAQDEKSAIFEKAKTASLSFGYNYCDFRPFVNAGAYNITTTISEPITLFKSTKVANATTTIKITNGVITPRKNYAANAYIPAGETVPRGTQLVEDKSYMQLWDSIDCRLAKYLGIGANPDAPNAPQFILLGVASVLMGPVGLVIMALTFTFLIFVVLIVVRIVHIYIIAFVAVILLGYISPLVFPMVFFDQMRASFEKWLKQLIAYSVQPIILFAFLAFMFAIFDSLIWGSNYDFYPKIRNDMVTRNGVGLASERIYDNTIIKVHTQDSAKSACDIRKVHKGTSTPCNGNDGNDCVTNPANDDCRCPDEDAIGCMYQNFGVDKSSLSIGGKEIFTVYNAWNANSNSGIFGRSSDQNPEDMTALEQFEAERHPINKESLSYNQYQTYMFNLLKLVFACFVIHALLQQVEAISATLTNIAGGAANMSAAPAASVADIGKGVVGGQAALAKAGHGILSKVPGINKIPGFRPR